MTNGLIKINGEDLGELPNPRRFIEWISNKMEYRPLLTSFVNHCIMIRHYNKFMKKMPFNPDDREERACTADISMNWMSRHGYNKLISQAK